MLYVNNNALHKSFPILILAFIELQTFGAFTSISVVINNNVINNNNEIM